MEIYTIFLVKISVSGTQKLKDKYKIHLTHLVPGQFQLRPANEMTVLMSSPRLCIVVFFGDSLQLTCTQQYTAFILLK